MGNGKSVRVNIWDASGDSRFLDVRNEFYKDTQGVILMFDVTTKRSFQTLDTWLAEVHKHSTGDVKCLLVGTKIESGPRVVAEQTARDWAKTKSLPYHEVSGALNKNVETAFKDILGRLM